MASAIIFDMDGLLIDSEPLWVRAEVETFAAAGVSLQPSDCGQTKGLRIDDVIRHWHDLHGFSCDPSEVERRLIARVIELVTSEGVAFAGVLSALAAARSTGARVALASSSPLAIIEAALTQLGIREGFDVVQSAQSETHGKPHPGIFLRTAEKLDVPPTRCIVLEDSMNGVIAAKAARMKCIAVPEKGDRDPRFVLADVVLSSLEEVTPKLLSELARR